MDAACTIQDSIHVFSLVHKYVSRILGTYHRTSPGFLQLAHNQQRETLWLLVETSIIWIWME